MEEKLFIIKCTPKEFKSVIQWAGEGIYDYEGPDGWLRDDCEDGDKASTKIEDQYINQEKIDNPIKLLSDKDRNQLIKWIKEIEK